MNKVITEDKPTTILRVLDQSDDQFFGGVVQLAKDNWDDSYFGEIVFTINGFYMLVDGVQQRVDTIGEAMPVIIDNELMLPISALIEEAGGTILINDAQQSIIIDLERVMELKFDSNIIYIDGESHYVNIIPVIMNASVLLPADIISKVFGFEVDWNLDSQQVILTRNFQTRRLILRSHGEIDLTNLGAVVAIKGPDNIAALQFATIQKTLDIYGRLSELADVVWVEPDLYIPSRGTSAEFDNQSLPEKLK